MLTSPDEMVSGGFMPDVNVTLKRIAELFDELSKVLVISAKHRDLKVLAFFRLKLIDLTRQLLFNYQGKVRKLELVQGGKPVKESDQ